MIQKIHILSSLLSIKKLHNFVISNGKILAPNPSSLNANLNSLILLSNLFKIPSFIEISANFNFFMIFFKY